MLRSEIVTPSITKLMNEMEENLSTFVSIGKVLGPIEEEAFFENNVEKEEYISKYQAEKVENKEKNTLGFRSVNRDLL